MDDKRRDGIDGTDVPAGVCPAAGGSAADGDGDGAAGRDTSLTDVAAGDAGATPSQARDPDDGAGPGPAQTAMATDGASGDAASGDAATRSGRLRRVTRAVAPPWRDRPGPRRPGVRVALYALVGAVVAVLVFGRVPAKIGPFQTTLSARPSLDGHTVVHLAPLGTIDLDTHDGPLTLDLRLEEIGLADAERIADDPGRIERLGDDAADEVRAALYGLAVRCVVAAVVGGIVGALAARLSWRAAAGGAGVAGLAVATLGLGAAATFDVNAVAEPRYTGLLTRAPTAVGDMEAVLDRFGEYRAQLSKLVDNMATLYLAGSDLPTLSPDGDMVRVLHVSDIHLNPQAFDMMEELTEQFGIDVVADTGDITDWGTDAEARLVSRIGDLDVPYVYVRGNHDSRRTQAAVADQPNAVVLDGEGATVAGLRFWGIGDPRYTPDKSDQAGGTEQERAEAFAPDVAERLADGDEPVDVAMVHDRRMALDLGGQVPLVLAGHTHEPARDTIEPRDDEAEDEDADTDATDGEDGSATTDTGPDDGDAGAADTDDQPQETLLLVEGSTGGAGLRGLQGEDPEPLTASVLYVDRETRRLVAYDHITVDWLEDTGATIERHIIGGPASNGDAEEPTG